MCATAYLLWADRNYWDTLVNNISKNNIKTKKVYMNDSDTIITSYSKAQAKV